LVVAGRAVNFIREQQSIYRAVCFVRRLRDRSERRWEDLAKVLGRSSFTPNRCRQH
jgi:hypothetical protein